MIDFSSDIIKQNINELLKDHTTGQNIIFATDDYIDSAIEATSRITPEILSKKDTLFSFDIEPRVLKTKAQKFARQKQKAEVFTPAFLCNIMTNHFDKVFFKTQKSPFNTQRANSWYINKKPLPFYNIKEFHTYIDQKVLEITCGEAPFIVSRYDSSSGKSINFDRRVGILDKKLRAINEQTTTKQNWLKLTYRAFRSVYGYEFSGDNLLIARINLLMTFIEHMNFRWQTNPTKTQLKTITNIITWNFWQMDGLNLEIPYIKMDAKIFNWKTKKALNFTDISKESKMKFDFIIGNPPYQESRESTKDIPVYNDFMDESYKLSDKVCLITPARFLFNAGATPKAWNEKMLNDEHFKVLKFVQKSNEVFSNTDIKGGVTIHYRDATKNFGAMEIFLSFEELNSIKKKVLSMPNFISLNTIMYPYSTYTLSDELWQDFPDKKERVEYIAKNRNKIPPQERKGELSNLRIITTNIFDLLPNLFFDKKPDNKNEYCGLIGRQNNKRVKKYILKRYINVAENYDKFKVILPKSNGSGALGETLSTPLIGLPLIGYTQSFLGIGSFDTKFEAQACFKYIKSKFARTMLGILKITQDNPPEKWKFVPLQDFTPNSDIDWSKSVSQIDAQLYNKYNLSKDEINFIESKVKSMEDSDE